MRLGDYRYQRINESSYDDLCFISSSAFGIDPGVSYFSFKNRTKCFGASHLGYIAYHNHTNEPAAFYGVYAYPVECNGTKYTGVQSGDTMTHKKHMGKGLFTSLANMTYELAQQEKIDFVFGFPNENSYHGFVKKLGWTHEGFIQLFKITVLTIPLLKVFKKLEFLSGLKAIWVKFIVGLYNGNKTCSFQSNETKNKLHIRHSTEFIEYKNFGGSFMIKIGGKLLWCKADGLLYVGDVEECSEVEFMVVLRGLKGFARLIGSDQIQFGYSKGSQGYKLLSKFIEPESGAAYGYRNFSNEIDAGELNYSLADLDTF